MTLRQNIVDGLGDVCSVDEVVVGVTVLAVPCLKGVQETVENLKQRQRKTKNWIKISCLSGPENHVRS
jgi:hypothetical protein